MRRNWFFFRLAVLIFLFSCSTGGAFNEHDREPNLNEKIAPALLIELERLKSVGQMEQQIAIIIKTKGNISEAERTAMEHKGARIGSTTGDVLTVTMQAHAITTLAELEFIIFIEKFKTQRVR